jgi:hypothetical protein
VEQPIFFPENSQFFIRSFQPLSPQIDTAQCRIVDSTGKQLKTVSIGNGYSLSVNLSELPDMKQKYTLWIDSTLRLENGKLLDTTLKFALDFPDPTSFGSVSGTIVGDSTKPDMKYVVIITGPPIPGRTKKESSTTWSRRIPGPGPFAIDYMPAGSYRISVIEDADGNGSLTPGSLIPYRMPERMFTNLPALEIKASWDLKNHKIHVIASGKGKSGSMKGGEDEESEEVDPSDEGSGKSKGK